METTAEMVPSAESSAKLLSALCAFGAGDFLVRLPVDGLSGIDEHLAKGA